MSLWENIGKYLNDVVDIALVSIVIYNLILLVRGTRAVQLLKGIMVIVAVWLLSSLFKLDTLQWLMSQAFNLGVFAILIIFQPELRRALEHLGSGKLFTQTLFQPDDEGITIQTIESIVKASDYLAKRRIGALMAIERTTGLNEYVETGTRLDAKLSAELLINIFIPNTPLHDGAVILSGNRVLAAACYLPLSENPDISKELGTRHRAGIGLSEVSDALVVIVSEETGQISLSLGGNLIRGISPSDLQTMIQNTLKPEKEQKLFWKRKGDDRG
ncbi:putative enzyme with DAC domain protein [[Clostridium] ultunense Esp]|uniref:diadenylate cyclase CdaA n=1 Tax=Thermicanus aegyptius TaxID=94009 RepID=UPI0002B7060A|nr:diadenylate cyclase CdaA [Thermicanus aegyptius]CCQ94400.1 putative enzyme with DAC domain protein [[Clostridium] ultunense Esp]